MKTLLSFDSYRQRSEDRAETVRSNGKTVILLADGAGGMSGGAEAAELFVKICLQAVQKLKSEKDCCDLLSEIDTALDVDAESGQTTGIVLVVSEVEVFGASVGDSSAWYFQGDERHHLTGGQMRKPFLGSGVASPRGFSKKISGGKIVVASDGLWKYTGIDSIAECVRDCAENNLAKRLIELVRLPSGTLSDDVAVVVCEPLAI